MCALRSPTCDLETDMEVFVSHLHAVDVLDGVQGPLGISHIDKPHTPALARVLLLQHFHAQNRSMWSEPAFSKDIVMELPHISSNFSLLFVQGWL